jgi:hypothetical protein
MKSLSDLIWCAKNYKRDHQIDLSKNQIDMIVSMIGYRCRAETKSKLQRRLALPLSLLKNHGIYDRLMIGDQSVEYICGQSWDDEMRTLRECLIKN